MEMNPFTLVNGKPYPLDMRGELDDTATFKNFNKRFELLEQFWMHEVSEGTLHTFECAQSLSIPIQLLISSLNSAIHRWRRTRVETLLEKLRMARNEIPAARAKAAVYKASIVANKAFLVEITKKIRVLGECMDDMDADS